MSDVFTTVVLATLRDSNIVDWLDAIELYSQLLFTEGLLTLSLRYKWRYGSPLDLKLWENSSAMCWVPTANRTGQRLTFEMREDAHMTITVVQVQDLPLMQTSA